MQGGTVDGAYVVDGLCPVVVVGGHVQLSHDVAGFSDLQDLDRRCIAKVDLLEEVHDAHEEQDAPVHLSHDPPVIFGRELGQKPRFFGLQFLRCDFSWRDLLLGNVHIEEYVMAITSGIWADI